MNKVLIKVENLKKFFQISKRGIFSGKEFVKAVDRISFEIYTGETLGLVGESGCGKSTLGRTVLRLHEPTAGKVIFAGKNIFELNRNEVQQLRKEMQIVFQDPSASLNPRMTVGEIVAEPMRIHGVTNEKEIKKRIEHLLDVVGLSTRHARRYPHEFSGGQRQRIGIARSLVLNPKFIVCDEPVSALDASIQSQIINLLQELQEEFKLTYLFIAHDLAVIKHISNRVGVMYLGKLVEIAGSEQIYEKARHPYTRALISAIPIPDPEIKTERLLLEGDVPSPINVPKGCSFYTRCPNCMPQCQQEIPQLKNIDTTGQRVHMVACHLYEF